MDPRRAGSAIALKVLAEHSGARLVGDGEVMIDAVAAIETATPGAIVFLANPKYRSHLTTTRASAVILSPRDAEATALPKLVSANPYATYAAIAALFHPAIAATPGIHRSAEVAPTARVAASATIGPNAVIGEGTIIGERSVVHAGCVVGDDCVLADDVVLHPRVVAYARTRIGARTMVHSGAVLGADGFGMAELDGHWLKVPQVGGLAIGADVEIGANTTIDRGALGDTVIEDDVKLDNQIQIGHNCHIGAHTAIAGCVGIAGSTRIGRNCRIGGAAMIAGHLSIADGTTVSASTGVFNDVREPGIYTAAFPSLPHREWQHVASITRHLRTLLERVRALERAQKHKGE
jgi:UDP-3-O-[3-hydroxymyristoyl] glucosamine N-acyltransferase